MNAGRLRGFTLIELLIGLTLLGLIVSLLLGGLRLASRSSDAAATASDQANRMRIVDTLLRRELAAVFPYRWKNMADMKLAFSGAPGGVRFISSTSPRGGQGGLQMVEMVASKAEGGMRLLMRRRPPDRGQRDFDRLEDGDSWVLLPDLQSASFEYFGSDTPAGRPYWRDKWDNPHRLPRLIRISLQSSKAPSWPEVVVALRVNENAGCRAWDAVNGRCWG